MQSQTYTYQGISGLKAISEHFGVPKGTLSTRITQMGMSLEEAIHAGDSVKSRRKCKHEYNGIQGLKNIAASVGICHQTLNHRMMKGMTLEEAIAAGRKCHIPASVKNRGLENVSRSSASKHKHRASAHLTYWMLTGNSL